MPGSASELEVLYRRHGDDLRRYLRGRVRDDGDADDALQETFVQAALYPDRWVTAPSPRAWLFGVARHVASGLRRSWRTWKKLPDEPPAAAPVEDERLAAARRALAALPDEQREPLELRLLGELSYAEIAAALDLPIGTVRSRLHYAMERLRAATHAALEDER
ncbi:MAG: RNA polymerase sigma factor [Phycisphaerae bacterium]